MISAFLRTLTPEQEDRLLTRGLVPRMLHISGTDKGCLIGVAFDCGDELRNYVPQVTLLVLTGLGTYFNAACERFGVARVSAAIRARILSNRARRLLVQPPVNFAVREEVTV